MGIRFHRSLKLMPGVRLNFSGSGVGVSVGVPGARMSFSPTGRITQTVGLPGTGLSVQDVVSSKSRRSQQQADAELHLTPGGFLPTLPPKPGFFGDDDERALWHAINDGDLHVLRNLAAGQSSARRAAAALASQVLASADDDAAALAVIDAVWTSPQDFTSDPLCRRYFEQYGVEVGIAAGVRAPVALDGIGIGLMYIELLQLAGDLTKAIDVALSLPQNDAVRLSLAELLIATSNWKGVLGSTNGVTNTDDITALTFIYRGMAFRESAMYTAAAECFGSVIRTRSRASQVRQKAFAERALMYAAQGQRAKALADVERIRVEDASSSLADRTLATINAGSTPQ